MKSQRKGGEGMFVDGGRCVVFEAEEQRPHGSECLVLPLNSSSYKLRE